MIKCDGFGKLLKQGFFILLISCFIFLGSFYVNGVGATQPVGLDKYASAVNSGFKVGFLKGGGLLTEFLGQSKSILALDSNILFWWATNGEPYFYSPSFQGFFSNYYACPVITYSGGFLQGCDSGSPMTGDYKNLFKSFFSKVNAGDLVYYRFEDIDNGVSCVRKKQNIVVCFSSEEIGNSLCFSSTPVCINGCQGGALFCDSSNYFGNSLVRSQNLSNLTFGLISNSWIGKAPGQLGYNDSYEGGSQGSIDIGQGSINITGDFVFNTCTNGDIISSLEEEGYNKYMCYGGIDTWTNFETGVDYNPVPLSGLSLHYILSHDTEFASYDSWFTYFYNLQQRTIGGNDVYLNKWTNYPAVYKTYFDLFFEYGGNGFLGNINDLNQYCGMVDSVDYNQVYDGNYFRNKCASIISSNYNGGNYAGSGQYSAGVNWGSNVKPQTNAVEFIQDFFNKLNEVLPTNYSDVGLGFLPVYIISFMIALIFFRFLMK